MNDRNRNKRSTSDTDVDRKNSNEDLRENTGINQRRDTNTDQRSDDSDLTNPVNTGNLSDVTRTRSNRELHSKNSVTGSDHDGQAD